MRALIGHRHAVPIAVACGLAIVWALLFHDLRFDDGFITLRYSQNLAQGRGFVFNPGQPRLGTTSPGHALIGVPVYALLGRDLTPDVMSALGAASAVFAMLCLFFLLREALSDRVAALISLLCLLGTAAEQNSALETNLVMALWLAALLAWRRRALVVVGLLLGAAVLLRPDSLLVVAILALDALRERLPLKAVAAGTAAMTAVVAPWVAWATWFFGSPVPLTLGTKKFWSPFLMYLEHEILSPIDGLHLPRAPILVLALWVFTAVGVRLAQKHRGLLLTAAICFAYGAAYAYLRPNVMFVWHLAPFYLGVIAFSGVGYAQLTARWPALTVGGLLALIAFNGWSLLQTRQALPTMEFFGSRDEAYRAAAEFLNAQPRTDDDSFASVEVGTLAYLTDLPVVDFGGLVSTAEDRQHGRVHWLVTQPGYHGLAPQGAPAVFRYRSAGGYDVAIYDVSAFSLSGNAPPPH